MAIKTITIGNKKVSVSQQIADRIAQANADMVNATGTPIAINQSFRTKEQQQELYNKLAPKGARVAPPGKSFHETGNAIDVSNWEQAQKYLKRYGLVNDLSDDKGHFSYGETQKNKLENFADSVEKGRQRGLTDTQLLDVFVKKHPDKAQAVQQAKANYSNPQLRGNITNDRDLINFLALKYSGVKLQTPSVPEKIETQPEEIGVGEKVLRGGLGFIGKVGESVGNFERAIVSPVIDISQKLFGAPARALGEAVSGQPVGDFSRPIESPTGNVVQPAFTLSKEDLQKSYKENLLKGVGEMVQAGAEIAPYAFGGGEVGAVKGAVSIKKALPTIKAATKVATGFGGAKTIEETGKQLQEGKIKPLTALGKGLETATITLPIDLALRGAVNLNTSLANKSLEKSINKAVIKSEGTALQKLGQKIQEVSLKPTVKDLKAGFKIENLAKYDVGGSPAQVLEKTNTAIGSYMKNLKDLIAVAGDIPTTKTYGQLLDDLERSYKGAGLGEFGRARQILNEVKNIRKELDLAVPDWKTKVPTLSEAIQMKRKAGLNAAFEHDITKSVETPKEKVWTDLYQSLKKETEQVAPPGFEEVNKAISELIPIEQAAIRRIPVEARNQLFNIYDTVGLLGTIHISPTAIGIPLIQRLSKSGKVGAALSKMGNVETPYKLDEGVIGRTLVEKLKNKQTLLPAPKEGALKAQVNAPIKMTEKSESTINKSISDKALENKLINIAKYYKTYGNFVKYYGKYYSKEILQVIWNKAHNPL